MPKRPQMPDDPQTEKANQLPDHFLNPFRLKGPEGQMIAIMKSSPDGELYMIVASVSGWHFRYQEDGFDPKQWDAADHWELIPDRRPETGYTPRTPEEIGMLENEFGVIVSGFGKALHIPKLKYTKWERKADGKWGLEKKDRLNSPFFFFQYNMGIPVEEIQGRANVSIDMKLNLVVRLRNPYKALFLAGGWESLLEAAVQAVARDYISNMTADEIRKEEEVQGGLVQKILGLNDDLPDVGGKPWESFWKRFGVEIIDVRFVDFNVAEDEVQKALRQREVNRLLAEAAVEKGREIREIGNARADAAKAFAEAFDTPEAAAIAYASEQLKEGLIETSASVVSVGTPIPLAITPPDKK